MGHDPRGRRSCNTGMADMIEKPHELAKGRKLVVQMVETFGANKKPVFVDSLDAIQVKTQSGLAVTPTMIYGDDVTHVITEEGIAYLYKSDKLRRTEKGPCCNRWCYTVRNGKHRKGR